MDEPLSSLDAKLRVEMRTELKRLHASLGATFIYVTHDQAEAMTMADRIVVMNQGRVQQVGPAARPSTAIPANRFVAGFFGVPAMNFIEGELAGREATPDLRGLRPASQPQAARDCRVPLGHARHPARARAPDRRQRRPSGYRQPDRAAGRRDARVSRLRRTEFSRGEGGAPRTSWPSEIDAASRFRGDRIVFFDSGGRRPHSPLETPNFRCHCRESPSRNMPSWMPRARLPIVSSILSTVGGMRVEVRRSRSARSAGKSL